MSETIIVCAIVGVVLVLTGRSLYRTFTGKNEGCSCGTRCPLSSTCQELSQNFVQGVAAGDNSS